MAYKFICTSVAQQDRLIEALRLAGYLLPSYWGLDEGARMAVYAREGLQASFSGVVLLGSVKNFDKANPDEYGYQWLDPEAYIAGQQIAVASLSATEEISTFGKTEKSVIDEELINPWRKNTGYMPVAGNIRVDVKIEDKVVPFIYNAEQWMWNSDNKYPITHWRYHDTIDVPDYFITPKTEKFLEDAFDLPVIPEGRTISFDEAIELAKESQPESVAPVRNKYMREIKPGVWVDVYDILRAFNVTDGALQHLLKKALAVGQRGHKDATEDYRDIVASATRALELHEEWK